MGFFLLGTISPARGRFEKRSYGLRKQISVLLFMLFLLPLFVSSVNAKSVISTSTVDLFPAGSFDDSTQWQLSSNDGYTTDPAKFTTPMIEDGMVSFTHNRVQTLQSSTVWSSASSTDSNFSKGSPDGWYTYSSGSDIKLSGFDTANLEAYLLEGVSVVIAFEIPDQLGDDTVEFSLNWDGNFEQFKTFNTPQTPANHMDGPYYVQSIDEIDDWAWDDFSDMEFNLNYQSVAPDDSQLNVDALGLIFTWQAPSYGFETAKAINTTNVLSAPLLSLDLSIGSRENIIENPCGLKKSGDSNEGVWISDLTQLPPEQFWGRVHTFGDWNGSVYIKSENDLDWILSDNSILGNSNSYYVKVVILSGCLENVIISINDPSLHIEGEVLGSVTGLDKNLSWLRISMNNNLVYEHPLDVQGSFSITIPVGDLLPYDESGTLGYSSGIIDIGVGVRFQWDSDGSAETTVVAVDTISLTGGYDVEWDYDPICDSISDLVGDNALSEDGGGALIPFRETCIDDNTIDLSISVESSIIGTDNGFLNAEMESEYLKLYPEPNAFGIYVVTVNVSDEEGNYWFDSFDVEVLPIEDSPEVLSLPSDVWLQAKETREYEFTITDDDTEIQDLSITSSHSWATVDVSNQIGSDSAILRLSPINTGSYSVVIEISDGISEPYVKTINVVANMYADLFVESIEVSTADGVINVGDVLTFSATIGNSGGVTADLISVRCFVNDILVKEDTIPTLESGKYSTIECTTQVDNSNLDNMEISVLVDYSLNIPEVSEDNNGYTLTVDVEESERNIEYSSSGDEKFRLTQSHMILLSILVIGVLCALLFFGPKKVKRV